MTDWLDIALVFALGGALSWLSVRFTFPNAVAQVVLGVLLGTAVLGWVPHSPLLHDIGELAVVLLLGVAGLELGFERLKAAGWAGAAVAGFGSVFSVVGGYFIAQTFGSPFDESVYLGLALGATSIGITVQVLEQYGLVGHRVADILIAAAVIDDVVALYLLGAAHGFLSDGFGLPEAAAFVALAIGVLGSLFFLTLAVTRAVFRLGWLNLAWRRAVWALALIALGATVTHALDLSTVVGAFFAGVGVGEGLPDEISEMSAEAFRWPVLAVMPFYFVMIGVQAQWDILTHENLWTLVFLLTVFAVAAKALGGVLGVLSEPAWRDRWLIGFGMVARGEVGLIIATLGFEQGHLSHPIFVALVLTTILVSTIGPLFMAPFAKRLALVPQVEGGR